MNDPDLSFREIVRKNMISVKNEPSCSNTLKLERPEDILKLDRNEIVVKLEKGEGTLKIEKIGSTPLKVDEEEVVVREEQSESVSEKVEPAEDSLMAESGDVSVKEDSSDLQHTKSEIMKTECTNSESLELLATEAKESENINNCDTLKKTLEAPPMDALSQDMEVGYGQVPKNSNVNDVSDTPDENKSCDVNKDLLDTELIRPEESSSDKFDKESMDDDKRSIEVKMETGSVKSESDINSVKEETRTDITGSDLSKLNSSGNMEAVDKFKAMFPELEVMHRFPEIDTTVVTDKQSTIAQLLQQSYQNPIKWPKDHALQVRLQHIVHCVEHKEWPVSRMFSAYSGGSMSSTQEGDQDNVDTPTSTPRSLSEGSEVITITTDHSSRQANQPPSKRKRHIAIDVETERGNCYCIAC